jgi:hypothetical protein
LANRSVSDYWLLHIKKKVIPFGLLALEKPPGAKKDFMKKTNPNNDMRTEYDFAAMKGGIRGKYAKRYREGTNLVLLEPDVSEAFPTDKAVNQALRGIIKTTRTVRSTGKLASKSVRPTQRRTRSKPS